MAESKRKKQPGLTMTKGGKRPRFMAIGLLLSLILAGAAFVAWGSLTGRQQPHADSRTPALPATPNVQSFSATSPAKEYIYSGGRLVATEEPPGGGLPTAPANLTATPGNAQVALNWTAVVGATGYNVKRSAFSGGGYATVITGVTSTSYTNSGLANGTTYYFVVSATNASGEGPNSNEASATPSGGTSPPPAPTGLTASAGNASVALAWNPAAGAGSYTVKRATVSGGPYTNVATGLTTTGYTNTGLTNGTIYYYVVSASNTAGESPNSNQASATPSGGPPAAPTGLAATPGNALVSLNWAASSGATGYNVKRATVTGGPYTTVASGVTSNSYTNTGLTNGTTYYYVVTAVNGAGESANSNQASATPSSTTAPNAPTNLRVTGFNTTSVNVAWDHDGLNLTGFILERKTGSGNFTQIATPTAAARSFKDSPVSHGTTYQYRIKAINNGVASAYSNTVTVTP